MHDISHPTTAEFGSSRAAFVYKYIFDRILSLELRPGSFIDKSDICETLGVSRQPVTAALTQLGREGLVEVLPQRGSYVMRLDPAFLKHTAFVRGAIEAAVAAEFALAPSSGLITELRAIVADQRAAVVDGDTARFFNLDETFHRTLVAETGCPDSIAKVEAGLTGLRRVVSIAPLDLATIAPLPDQHAAIVDAIECGDRPQAAILLIDHLRYFRDKIDALIEAYPTLFAKAA